MDDADLDRLLPIEIAPRPAKITRVALVIARNVDPALPDLIDQLISQLVDPDWKKREAASDLLASYGPAAEARLKVAAAEPAGIRKLSFVPKDCCGSGRRDSQDNSLQGIRLRFRELSFTTFYVYAAVPHAPNYNLTMARILIVEDDKPSADAMALMLRHVGHRVAIRSVRHELLGKTVMHETPDLVMLDLGIPGANGADVLEVLRILFKTSIHCPSVVWTGMADSDLAKRAKELGASAVIEKGRETPAQILQTIDSALQLRPN